MIGCRIVLRNKYRADGYLEKRKAKILAKGFSQRPGIDFHDTFAPVARLGLLRMLIALSIQMEMQVSQLDITSAYVYGDLDDEVYMEPPEFLKEMLSRISEEESNQNLRDKAKVMLSQFRRGHRTCLLKKALYGL